MPLTPVTIGTLTLTAANTQLAAGRAFVGTDDPSDELRTGTEYVWFETDGAGTLVDLWTGIV